MADNVVMNPGVGGATALTDDCTTGHAQIIKLAISADGDATLIPADASNGIDVDVTRLPALVAGSANIGDVDVLTVPAPLSTAGAGTAATALRTTLASDDPAVASLAVIDNIVSGSGANISQINGVTPLMGAGNTGTGSPRVTIATDQATIPVSIAATVTVDTELPAAAALADDTANPTVPIVGSAGLVYDPGDANWDRIRALTAALNTAAADSGIQAVGLVAQFDDTSPTAITENQFGNVRISSRREVYTQIRDAAGNERGLNIDANNEIGIGAIRTSVTPGTAAANLGKAEDAAHSSGDVGVQCLTVRTDTPASKGADNDYEPIQSNEVGAVWMSPTPSINGGASTMNASSSDGSTALTSTAQVIKASAGVLVGYYIYNPNSSAQFVQFYNTAAASVTVGTTAPLFMLTIPATSAANLSMSFPVAFGTAMSWSATSTAGGNGAPTTALDAVCWYK